MRTLWFHVHVPKAGGSTLRQLMNRSFGKGYYNSVSLLESKQYTCDDIRLIANSQTWLGCMSDHKLSLDLPYDYPDAKIQALAFVRDPVDRYVSRYFYHRKAEIDCAAKLTDFREFIEYELVQGNVEPQVMSQLHFLSLGRSISDMTFIQQTLATDQVVLYPVERFDEAAVCLEQKFPETFADLSYVMVNQAKRDRQVAAEDLELVREKVAGDVPLHDLSHQQLDHDIQTLFGNDIDFQFALRDFQARCAVRIDNFNPMKLNRMIPESYESRAA